MTRVLANVNHEGKNHEGEVQIFRHTNGSVQIRFNDGVGDEVALATIDRGAVGKLIGFDDESPRPTMCPRTFALRFRMRVFQPGWRYPIYLFLKGEASSEDTAEELGITREELDTHLAGLFHLGLSTCHDDSEHASVKEVERGV